MNLREQQAQQTFEKILLAAGQLLENCTIEALSVDQICQQAGVSKGGFYHHFSSKDQLVSLLIGQQMGKMIAEHVEPFLGKENAFGLLKKYADAMVEYLENCPRNILARCWLAIAEHPEKTGDVIATASFRALHAIVAQGQSEGTIRSDLDAEFCEAYINGTITGIMLYGSTFRDHFQLRAFAEDSLKLIYKTLS